MRGWYLVGSELFAEADRALEGEKDGQEIALSASLIAFKAYFMAWLDLSEEGYKLAEDSVKTLQQLDYPEAFLLAMDSLIVNAYFHNRWEQFKYTQLMLDVAVQFNDKWLIAFAMFAASMAELIKEDYPEARRQAEIHLQLCEEIGDKVHSTVSLIVLGHAALAQQDYDEAWDSYLRSLNLSQQTGFFYSLQTATK